MGRTARASSEAHEEAAAAGASEGTEHSALPEGRIREWKVTEDTEEHPAGEDEEAEEVEVEEELEDTAAAEDRGATASTDRAPT